MKILDLYKPAISSERAFVNSYEGNDNLQKLSRILWNNLNGIAPLFLIIAILVGVGICALYYGPYNNRPGRHYKPQKWCLFMFLCFVVTLLLTFFAESFFVKTALEGAKMIMFWISLQNAFYSVVIVYLFVSFIWCKFGHTKAYRIF